MADAPSGGTAPHDTTPTPKPTIAERAERVLFGPPRDLKDRRVFHHLAVAAFLAWVGLGADGLSSSAYGPEEAYRTLGEHTYLAVVLAGAVMATVFVISACYSRIIRRFPHGGGGYVVASALLGEKWGAVSGSALLVDYVLTITISIAAAGDALFSLSFVPPEWHVYKIPVEIGMIVCLTVMNIRGVKESIIALLPVFLLFLATHAVLIVGGIATAPHGVAETATKIGGQFDAGLQTLGIGGMLLLLVHAYSLGGGTYTGIEAVSNGMPIMREPRVRTATRTMVYMAVSLAVTAAGLIVCYLLRDVVHVAGKTLNAALAEDVAGALGLGTWFSVPTLVSEGLLLVVAAQAGFIDGPRVLANMAVDSWAPRRFAALSDRLTTRNGIVLMGAAALAALLYTRGDVRHIVVMYSINVFLTFSLSMLGMVKALWSERRGDRPWRGEFALFAVGLTFCATILGITIVEKFSHGGWITLIVTSAVVGACLLVRRHYRALGAKLAALYASFADLKPMPGRTAGSVDPSLPTAVIMVGGYSGLGIHTVLGAMKAFPGQFKNVVFVSAGIIDSGAFKGEDAVESLKRETESNLQRYVDLMRGQGIPAQYCSSVGTDVVDDLEALCNQVATKFPRSTFFAGQLVFERERWFQRLLHNETAYAVQKRLQLAGHTMVILPAVVK